MIGPRGEITSAALNARNAAARRAGATPGTDSGLALSSTGRGRAGRIARARPILATLSGPGPAYSFTEAIDSAAGTTTAGPRVGTAREVNGVTGLAGQVVRAYPDRSGGYRFQSVRAGGPPSVLEPWADCHGGPDPGTTVTITLVSDGSTVFSGPTDSHGQIAVSLAFGVAYSMTIAGYGAPRWADSRTFTATRSSGAQLISLPPAPGYICYGPCGYPMSNRMELTGGRQSPVLLAFGHVPERDGAAGYRGTAPADGPYSTGGDDVYYVVYGSRIWEVGGRYAPGSGDPSGGPFSCSSFDESLGHWSCDPFVVHFPDCGNPDFGDAGTWTMIEAPPVP